jgi:predicted nucleotidyltransferase
MSQDRLYDFSGWDLSKFLRHLVALNLSVSEWSTSPVVYLDEGLGNDVAEYVRRNSAYRLLVPSHRGMLLSQKACGLENVKRAMYAARSILALRVLLDKERMPRDFTWQVLMEESDLPAPERALLERLHALKVSTHEKSGDLPEDIREYLQGKREEYRNMELVSVRGVNPKPKEKASLDAIWERFTAM